MAKTAAKMRVVAPMPRPQMIKKVFLVDSNVQVAKFGSSLFDFTLMDMTSATFQGNQQQPIEETRIPSLKESMLVHELDLFKCLRRRRRLGGREGRWRSRQRCQPGRPSPLIFHKDAPFCWKLFPHYFW